MLVEDDEGADDAGDPAATGEDGDDEHRAAALVNHGKRREDDG